RELCAEFGVSRTVVREAVASLRLGGRLFARQGLGVFVEQNEGRKLTFPISQADDIVSAMRILELRLGIEVEAVAHAARRRSPEGLKQMTAAYDRLNPEAANDHERHAGADLEFHMAIARATGNPYFVQFLEALAADIGFELRLKHSREEPASYIALI